MILSSLDITELFLGVIVLAYFGITALASRDETGSKRPEAKNQKQRPEAKTRSKTEARIINIKNEFTEWKGLRHAKRMAGSFRLIFRLGYSMVLVQIIRNLVQQPPVSSHPRQDR